MAVQHSPVNLASALAENVCFICQESYDNNSNLVSTRCRHIFHHACIFNFLNTSSSCPQCNSTIAKNSLLEYPVRDNNESLLVNTGAIPKSTERILSGNKNQNKKGERTVNRNSLPGQASVDERESLEDRIRSKMENHYRGEINKLHAVVERLSQQLTSVNLNGNRAPEWPRDSFANLSAPSFPPAQPESNFVPQRNNRPNSTRPFIPESRERALLSSVALNNSGKIASLIHSWNLTFNGNSTGLPVEKFIYMVNSLTLDSLAGDFRLLGDHCHILFTSKAKEWYWRYRSSVDKINWEDLCRALKSYFSIHLSDLDIREMIRDRKQNANESFDDFHHSILQLCDRLRGPLSEPELTEILRRNLRPHLRKELFYLQIDNVSHLRHLVLRREALSFELDRAPKNFRRQVNEIDVEDEFFIEDQPEEVCEVRKPKEDTSKRQNNICWNCRKEGHRYIDCLEDRTIFCYGCGSVGVYKPQCEKCQGNFQASASNNTSFRSRTK